MPTLLVFHEVDDVEEWLKSPRREEIFRPAGVTARRGAVTIPERCGCSVQA